MGLERRTLIKPNSHKSLKLKLVGDKKVGRDISRMGKTIKAHASGGIVGFPGHLLQESGLRRKAVDD